MNLIEAIDGSLEIIDTVGNWREVVRKCGKMLSDRGCIEERYIQKMIKTCEELGPYIVIAPGVAIPHAAPEDGARELGVALLVIKNGVNFGSHNDPVYVVLAFATPDRQAHLGILKEISQILDGENIAVRLKEVSSKEEIKEILLQILNKHS